MLYAINDETIFALGFLMTSLKLSVRVLKRENFTLTVFLSTQVYNWVPGK